MKGIVLAGGSGTRLFPITKVVSKQLIPIYNKPMIYYPLSTLMLAGIKDILIISTPEDISKYEELLGNGENFGIKLTYKIQNHPNGIAEAFIIGEDFIGSDDVCLILGDNIFYGISLPRLMLATSLEVSKNNFSIIFGYKVKDPERYGVVEFDDFNNAISIEEKPINPKSNNAVVGLYFFKNDVIKIAKTISPSPRGELEITSVNLEFLKQKRLKVKQLESVFWLDTGTYDSLTEASSFIRTIENRDAKKVSCLEEIAYKYDYISKNKLNELINIYNNEYGEYLRKLVSNEKK
tara:strand:- start:385 stop:1263 length:879 start_codon:yes stop_codon:yes gene_type:complete